jgi:hypothetical protein
MPVHRKFSYHPAILIAFYLHCLPPELLQHIPRSTRHDWNTKNVTALFGYDWYLQNQHLFSTLQQVAINKKLLKINKALLRAIALKRFITNYSNRIKKGLGNINSVALFNLSKITAVTGLRTALKYLQLPYAAYLKIRKKQKCISSLLDLCRLKHPSQLLKKETGVIKTYCTDKRFIHWPLSSVYHQLRRDRAAFFSIATFYKYSSLLNLRRALAQSRRKNHHTGIRASAPLHILHADVTIHKTADNCKNYVYLVQDNFSRAILKHTVALECKAQTTFENISAVKKEYLQPAGIEVCELVTDDGPENHGPVRDLVACADPPLLKQVIAQQDITFSNSMIEAANKQLKYRFLYHHHIADHNELIKYVHQAVDDYNNRPHHILGGLTPLEVLNGKNVDAQALKAQIATSKAARITENKKEKCCSYSF